MGGKKLRFAGEYYPFMTPEQRALADRNQLQVPRGLVPARALHGAGVAISLEAFREVGPFHEGYFLYWEEADWFIRAKQRGWELYVDGDSVVEHVGGASDSNSNKTYYLSRNRFLAYEVYDWRPAQPTP